jgi:glycosyltransferase involved in cell wall biosynthesis
MLVSIITVCFNSAGTISDTLDSVMQQSYQEIEHIVIDGGSTDGTLDIIMDKANANSILVSEQDFGIYDAMNKGLKLANGEIIGFLNSDDVLYSSDIIAKVASTIRIFDVDSCYGDLLYVAKDDLDKTIRFWKSCNHSEELFYRGWIPPHPTCYFKKSVYENYGKFNVSYQLAADFDLLFRFFWKNKISSKYLPEVLVKMRLGGATNRNIRNILYQNIEIIRIYGFKNPLVILRIIIFKIYNRIFQYYYANLIK